MTKIVLKCYKNIPQSEQEGLAVPCMAEESPLASTAFLWCQVLRGEFPSCRAWRIVDSLRQRASDMAQMRKKVMKGSWKTVRKERQPIRVHIHAQSCAGISRGEGGGKVLRWVGRKPVQLTNWLADRLGKYADTSTFIADGQNLSHTHRHMVQLRIPPSLMGKSSGRFTSCM